MRGRAAQPEPSSGQRRYRPLKVTGLTPRRRTASSCSPSWERSPSSSYADPCSHRRGPGSGEDWRRRLPAAEELTAHERHEAIARIAAEEAERRSRTFGVEGMRFGRWRRLQHGIDGPRRRPEWRALRTESADVRRTGDCAFEARTKTPAGKPIVGLSRPFDDSLPRRVPRARRPFGRCRRRCAERKSLHHIEESTLRRKVEAADFKLVAEGDFWRHPEDTRDFTAQPPTKPADEFVLKFQNRRGTRPSEGSTVSAPCSLRARRQESRVLVGVRVSLYHANGISVERNGWRFCSCILSPLLVSRSRERPVRQGARYPTRAPRPQSRFGRVRSNPARQIYPHNLNNAEQSSRVR
jgi:hypothetical protein